MLISSNKSTQCQWQRHPLVAEAKLKVKEWRQECECEQVLMIKWASLTTFNSSNLNITCQIVTIKEDLAKDIAGQNPMTRSRTLTQTRQKKSRNRTLWSTKIILTVWSPKSWRKRPHTQFSALTFKDSTWMWPRHLAWFPTLTRKKTVYMTSRKMKLYILNRLKGIHSRQDSTNLQCNSSNPLAASFQILRKVNQHHHVMKQQSNHFSPSSSLHRKK